MAQFLSKPFGMTPNGEKINEYIISNPGGLAVSVLNYGCIIKNIWVPTKRGPVDVVLGHDTYADYVKDFESSGSLLRRVRGPVRQPHRECRVQCGRQDLPAGSQQREKPPARYLPAQAV